jgi:hypothetical protein
MQQAADAAQEALRQADPWDGLRHYISACVEFGSGGLAPISGHIQTTPEMWETHKRASRNAERLIRRARSAGVLRPGATGLDVALLIEQFSRRPGPRDGEQDNSRDRLLAIAIDGLHSRNSEPLPGRPPSRRRYEGRWVPSD